jgi:hypothetical protein
MESLTDEQLKQTAAFKQFCADKFNSHSRLLSLGLSYDGSADQALLDPKDPRSHIYQFRALYLPHTHSFFNPSVGRKFTIFKEI